MYIILKVQHTLQARHWVTGEQQTMTTHGKAYNQFLQSLESKTKEGFFFHDIENCIYITSDAHRLLGIWDKKEGKPHENWRDALPPAPQ